MKIIAQTNRSYLVEATEDELANIAGFTYLHELRAALPGLFHQPGGYGTQPVLKIGATFDTRTPHAMFTALRTEEKKVETAISVLRTTALLLEKEVPAFAKIEGDAP